MLIMFIFGHFSRVQINHHIVSKWETDKSMAGMLLSADRCGLIITFITQFWKQLRNDSFMYHLKKAFYISLLHFCWQKTII